MLVLINAHIYMWETAVETLVTVQSVCHKCGTIEKSGRNSCCGRGGSWFKNCRSAGDAKLRHTWYEGIQVCSTRSQSKRARGRQSNPAQRFNSSGGVATRNSKAVMTTAQAFVFTPVNTSILMPGRSIESVSTSTKKSTDTPDDTPTEHYTITTNLREITMAPTTTISLSVNTPMTRTSTIAPLLISSSAKTPMTHTSTVALMLIIAATHAII